jgi:hypothetical protein
MTVSLEKNSTPTSDAIVEGPTTVEILTAQLQGILDGVVTTQVFGSGNTGVRGAKTLKAPEARTLGLLMPSGSKLVMSVSAYIVDPANSKDA